MRRSALVLLIAAIASGPGPDRSAEPLPPLNAKVAAFARANLGRPVGDGICITLAVEALDAAGAKRFSFRDTRGDYTWGQPVEDLKEALPGDILQFRDAVFRGKRSLGRGRWISWHQEYPHHTAIVARIEQAGKRITILHQNVTVEGRDDSEKGTVQEATLQMDSLQKGGWVRAYRPVATEPLAKPPVEEEGPG